MKKEYKIIVIWLTAIVSIFVFYSSMFTSPNSILFKGEGDALKNYYTYKYYIDNNTNLAQFEGMNYPYGESIIFTDQQPALSFIIKTISFIFPSINNVNIGIMHYFIILSFIFSFYFFYKILQFFHVNYFIALIGALSITLLSPQFLRLWGHFSLTYLIFYPLTIYYLLNTKNIIKSNLILFFTTTFAFFTHPYIGISIFFMIIFVKMVELLQKSSNKKEKIYSIIIQAILPIIIFFVFSVLLDQHTNRSPNPYGLYNYHSTLSSIFLPSFNPIKEIYSSFIPIGEQEFEGIVYTGLLSNILIIYIIITSVFSFFTLIILKQKKHNFKLILSKELLILFIPSFLLLLFSFGIPHVYLFPKLQEIFPFIKQFRALGRFAWFFYFIINISAFVYFNHIFFKYKKTIVIPIVLIAILLLHLSEIWILQNSFSKNIGNDNNLFNTENANKYSDLIDKIDNTDYQAIIPLPFFHIGSEEIKITGSSNSRTNTMLLSYYWNLPIIGSMGSRTSMDETIKALSVFLPNFYKKDIMNDIKDKRPFLIVRTKEKIQKNERYLQYQADLITENDKIALYSISYDKLFEYKQNKEIIINEYKQLYNNKIFTVSDTSKLYKYYSFDNNENSIYNFKKGSAKIDNNKDTILLSIKSEKFSKDKTYYLCAWVYNKRLGIKNRILRLDEIDSKTNKRNQQISKDAKSSMFIYKDWTLYEFSFQPKSNNVYYNLYAPSIKKPDTKFTYIDDILLKENDLDVFMSIPNSNKIQLYYNNNFIDVIDTSEIKNISDVSIKRITNDKYWYKFVKEQANKEKIPVDSMLIITANNYYKINKIIYQIYNNKEWVESIKTQAKERDISYNYMLIRSANWYLQHQ